MTTRLIACLDQWAGPVALETAIAVTLILVVAILVSWGLRPSAASLRHRVWSLAILSLLGYPLVQPLLPKLSLGLWVVSPERAADARPAATNLAGSPSFAHHAALPVQNRTSVKETPARTNPSAGQLLMSKPQVADDGSVRPPVAKTPTQASVFHWPSIFAAVWAMGAVIGLGFLGAVHLAAHRLVRAATIPADSPWIELAGAVAAQLGVRRRVAVRISDRIAVPVTAGWLRPTILLPNDCDGWSSPRRRMVLIHEMSHVARGDVLWEIAAKLACVIYWPHPLVWLAGRRMRVEREAACDDAVLRDVERPSEYASLLLDVATCLADRPVARSTAAIAMACGRSVEERIRWIVQPGRCRLPVSRRTARWFSIGAIVLVLGLGSISIFAGPQAPAGLQATTDGQKPDQERLQRAGLTTPADAKSPAGTQAGSNEWQGDTNLLCVRVLDPQGKPLADARVHASVWTEEKGFNHNRDYKTDTAGIARVELPKTYQILRLWAGKKPFVTMFSHWEQNELASGVRPPAEYAIPLERAVSAGGRIVDEAGKPIAGAHVQVRAEGGTPIKSDGRTGYNTWLATGTGDPRLGEDAAAVTDSDGRWRIGNVPDNSQIKLVLLVSHPDYSSDESWGQLQNDAGITTEMLRKQSATLTLKRGFIVQGRVTDPDGNPIKDAMVVQGNDPYFASTPKQFLTDADGRFRLPALPSQETSLTIIAPGFAPQLRKISVQKGLPPQDFQMALGKPVQLRFVDTAGKPIPQVYVQIKSWRGGKSLCNIRHPKVLDTKIPERADKNGVWEWTWAPDDPVNVNAYSYPLKGYAPSELEITGGDPPRTVTLKPEHRITGRVTDAITGKPLPDFTVIPIDVFRKSWLNAERFNAKAGKDGRLDYLAERTDIPLRLRIEAIGYRTQTGPEFRVGDDTSRTQNFLMQPSKPVTGIVLDAAGKPVTGAAVLVATPTEWANIGGKNDDMPNGHQVSTDAAGRFELPDSGEPFIVLAQADAGFAMADFATDQHDVGRLRLQPWALVRGQFYDGGQPVKGATILLDLVQLENLDRPRVETTRLQVTTDKDGRFEFPRVPPLPVNVRVLLGPWRDEGFRSGPRVPLDLRPGQAVELKLGEDGASVHGRVKLVGKVPADLDCTYSLNYLVSRSPGIALPTEIAKLGFDIRKGWQATWAKTMEGQAYLRTLRRWYVKLAPDGSFRVSGAPPGDYDLAIEIYAKPSGCLVDPLAQKVVRVTVTAADVARGELVLPEIAATVVPIPAVGDASALSFERADGTIGSLADFHSRWMIVHFWASWCKPCKRQLPALRQTRERFAARNVALLSLSLDEDTAAWRRAWKGPRFRAGCGPWEGVGEWPWRADCVELPARHAKEGAEWARLAEGDCHVSDAAGSAASMSAYHAEAGAAAVPWRHGHDARRDSGKGVERTPPEGANFPCKRT